MFFWWTVSTVEVTTLTFLKKKLTKPGTKNFKNETWSNKKNPYLICTAPLEVSKEIMFKLQLRPERKELFIILIITMPQVQFLKYSQLGNVIWQMPYEYQGIMLPLQNKYQKHNFLPQWLSVQCSLHRKLLPTTRTMGEESRIGLWPHRPEYASPSLNSEAKKGQAWLKNKSLKNVSLIKKKKISLHILKRPKV